MDWIKNMVCFLFLMALLSCANQQLPTGGPLDEKAPEIDLENSTANQQTNVKPKEIEIYFNEWVKLEDAFNQIVISPPTEKRPDISVKGKSIRIKFDKEEELRDNATYTINFGDAIKDITANNVLKNYSYVFSTGPFIDSLEIQGKVVNTLDGKAMENITVMLYDNLADSVVYTEKPFYFAKTNKEGSFKIGNIKDGMYKVVAIEDINRNFKFEKGNEKIGFLLDPILIKADSSYQLNIRAGEVAQDLILTSKKIKEKGKIVLSFNAKPNKVQLDLGEIEPYAELEYQEDSIYIWYTDFPDSSFQIITSYDTLWADTLLVRKDRVNEAYSPFKITSAENLNNKELCKGKSIKFVFNRAIGSIDRTKISVIDSSQSPINIITTYEKNELLINADWEALNAYELQIDSGAITGRFGQVIDSTGYKFVGASIKDFANLNLQINNLEEDQQYLVALLNGNNLIFEETISADSTYNRVLELIKPTKYNLRIIQDGNQNGKWDGPNYDLKLQAEKISISAIEDLRANWDKELIINWKEK